MARLIEEVRTRLREGNPLDSLGASDRELRRTLTMLVNDENVVVRQRASRELGLSVSRMSPAKIETTIRRLMWRLNPESGDNPSGVPEAVGEIGHRSPQQMGIFLPAFTHLLEDEKLRPGLLQALGRIGERSPEILSPYIGEIGSFIGHQDPVVSANAVLALARTGAERVGDALRDAEDDARPTALFCGNDLKKMKVCELVDHAAAHADALCFVVGQEENSARA